MPVGGADEGKNGCPIGDACAPAWADPVSRVPNFLGSFVARGSRACQDTLSTTLTYTGGGEGFTGTNFDGLIFNQNFNSPLQVNGPGGPYFLQIPIDPLVQSGAIGGNGTFPLLAAVENSELTGLIQANFPGASFVNGTLDFDQFPRQFVLNYVTGLDVCVNLPNPSGGGLVGRNKYFDNGSPMPRDRVYFFYNRVGNFNGLGSGFDVNCYVLGFEKTFLNDCCSVEVRIPLAGTANSDQVGGRALAVDHAEFGNVGLVLKAALVRTPNFLFSAGLGVSLPTADDSRMFIGGTEVVAIKNQTCLIQPILGMIWAPTDRCYAQVGLQFDFDPAGNPVQALNAAGGLSRIGKLHEPSYSFLSCAAGYWLYQNDGAGLNGVALQGELHYDASFGGNDRVQSDTFTVADVNSDFSFLTGSVGAIMQFGPCASLSVGVNFPLESDRLHDWNLIAQFNYQFGGWR